MRIRRPAIELLTLLYILGYIPYIAATRWLSSTVLPGFSEPLRGIEIIPATLILTAVMLVAFFALSGWGRAAHQWRLGGLSLPRPTRWTLLSGLGTALILVTVPLSFTFKNVSIPFVQLLMRGDILIVAPLVDMLARRPVRWYSWAALALTGVGLAVGIQGRGNLDLPVLCWITIGLYTLGYFGRLAVMSKIAKTGAPQELQRYYVEEQLVATPVALLLLVGLSLVDIGVPGQAIHLAFVDIWTSSALLPLAGIALTLFVVSLLAISILLDPRENTFCVPLERSGSILAGIVAAFALAAFGQKPPSQTDVIGALLLVAAICVLAIGPRLRRKAS